jgi:hypothetical protein
MYPAPIPTKDKTGEHPCQFLEYTSRGFPSMYKLMCTYMLIPNYLTEKKGFMETTNVSLKVSCFFPLKISFPWHLFWSGQTGMVDQHSGLLYALEIVSRPCHNLPHFIFMSASFCICNTISLYI